MRNLIIQMLIAIIKQRNVNSCINQGLPILVVDNLTRVKKTVEARKNRKLYSPCHNTPDYQEALGPKHREKEEEAACNPHHERG